MKMKVISRVCFVLAVMFMFIGGVKAKVYTIDEMSETFNNSEYLKNLNELFESNINSSVNSNSNEFLVNFSNYTTVFNYTDEYIEYDGRNIVITEDNVDDNMYTAISIVALLESVIQDLGYENMELEIDEDSKLDYDTFGVSLETEEYEFSGGENGNTWTSSGSAVKYFKMSLDTSKIDQLVQEYGVEATDENSVFEFLVPIISIDEITSNSVGVTVTTPKNDISKTPMCYIYRSTSEDGEYEKISDWAVNCDDDGTMTITDEGLNPNTTYYYKAIVNGGTNYSDVISVTTKGLSDEKANNVSNPKTGTSARSNLILSLLIISVLMILLVLNRRYSSNQEL